MVITQQIPQVHFGFSVETGDYISRSRNSKAITGAAESTTK